MSNIFAAKHFHDEAAAREWFEAARWPDDPVCPFCGSLKHYATKKLGRYRCGEKECRKDFTVTTRTVMERSHARLTQWAMAFWLGASSKKGFSAHQLHRALGCQYNTAWFLHHRVMEAMREGGLSVPLGGAGEVVEVDETYIGKVENPRTHTRAGYPYRKRSGTLDKRVVITLVHRGGKARSFHVPRADKKTVMKIVADNISHESRVHTDDSRLYDDLSGMFSEHETVNHSAKEYARGDVTTNTVEGFFSVFKRGMRGVYQHCGEKHLHRYVAEFNFRFNRRAALGWTDEARCIAAICAGDGKRLTYHQSRSA
ncbi:MAG: IS1595 family transposase [Rhizomicrobium sp.]